MPRPIHKNAGPGCPNFIARVTPAGAVTELSTGSFETGTCNGAVRDIATGPDGNVWFTLRFSPQLGRISPSGDFTFFPIPNNAEQITRGDGDTLYFTEFGASRIARITTEGVVTESPEFRFSQPTGITAGPRRSVWFLGYGNNKVYTTTFPR